MKQSLERKCCSSCQVAVGAEGERAGHIPGALKRGAMEARGRDGSGQVVIGAHAVPVQSPP